MPTANTPTQPTTRTRAFHLDSLPVPSTRPARRSRALPGMMVAAIAIAVCAPPEAHSQALQPRAAVIKPRQSRVVPQVHRADVIQVKFQDGLRIRLQQGALTDFGTQALTPANTVLTQFAGGRWERVHTVPEDQLDRLRARAQTQLRRAIADLNLEFFFHLPAGADIEAALDAFNALPIVELATPVPLPVAAPVPPNFQPNQGYLNAPTAGVDTPCMWQLPSGTGTNVSIADLEYSWNLAHVDLPAATLLGGTPTDPFNDDNHGTAVLGELGGINNGNGVTGIAYNSPLYVVAVNVNNTQNVAGAITTATSNLTAGDIILIEQQYPGPNYTGIPQGTQFGLVPVEWSQTIYNAIVTAVGNGIVVIEPAGNGSQNLDAAVYSTGNGGHYPFQVGNDSGAIIVGAGAVPGGSDTDRSRLGFSNYGATVDLQGWGEKVYTTGYNDAYSAEGKNAWFTATFGGTSSASPIVAGAAALLQSTYFAATGTFLTPAQVKTNLQATASAQQSGSNPASQNIGPRPHAASALANALPAIDANANLVPDLCDGLAGIEACCFTGGGCTDTTPANCTANSGTPQGPGTACATTTCPAGPPTEACCYPQGNCADVTPAVCTSGGGTPQGPGTTCATTTCPMTEACCFPGFPPTCADMSAMNCQLAGGLPEGPGTQCATTVCKTRVPKFQQPPTQQREDIASNIDMVTMQPNVVVADDFQSDGRPITCVKWWGSYLDGRYAPPAYGGQPTPFEIDGWLISFHEPLDNCPPATGGRGLLGLYFAEAADVVITPTTIPACDGHAVYEYTVELLKCCLLHTYPDSRSGWQPAQFGNFFEEHCFLYDLDIQAVVGASWELDLGTGQCIPVSTPNLGFGADFWGWHATDIENGFRPAQQSFVTMGPSGEWWYGPWSDVPPICGPAPVNMAFELITDDPNTPPTCMEACCDAGGGCFDALPADCFNNGGIPQGPGTHCAITTCPLPIDCCLPDGSCANLTPADCAAQGGSEPPGAACLGDADTNGIDDACEAAAPAYVLEFSLDIGSDHELSDPVMDGDEAFDPGDVYARPSGPVFPPGRDGFKDDFDIFGCDPAPDPPVAIPGSGVPLPGAPITDYDVYFDLDGHDQLDVDLVGGGLLDPVLPLGQPINQFPTGCVHLPEHLLVSFDDDLPEGWPVGLVPTTSPSVVKPVPWGRSLQADEVVGLDMVRRRMDPPLPLQTAYAAGSEAQVHASLFANPDAVEEEDDDVDSLDIVPAPDDCPYWYFSADHEGALGLDPGSIYLATPAGPVLTVDDVTHLGISEDADVDAFEFVWFESPAQPGMLALAVLFSVDTDDPLTGIDESGGLDPFALYVSFLDGVNFLALPGMFDDIDAVTAWSASLRSCGGDCRLDGVVDAQDTAALTGCLFGPLGGLADIYCTCGDFDGDHDVDLRDFAKFQGAYGAACP
jgi:serine protease